MGAKEVWSGLKTWQKVCIVGFGTSMLLQAARPPKKHVTETPVPPAETPVAKAAPAPVAAPPPPPMPEAERWHMVYSVKATEDNPEVRWYVDRDSLMRQAAHTAFARIATEWGDPFSEKAYFAGTGERKVKVWATETSIEFDCGPSRTQHIQLKKYYNTPWSRIMALRDEGRTADVEDALLPVLRDDDGWTAFPKKSPGDILRVLVCEFVDKYFPLDAGTKPR